MEKISRGKSEFFLLFLLRFPPEFSFSPSPREKWTRGLGEDARTVSHSNTNSKWSFAIVSCAFFDRRGEYVSRYVAVVIVDEVWQRERDRDRDRDRETESVKACYQASIEV